MKTLALGILFLVTTAALQAQQKGVQKKPAQQKPAQQNAKQAPKQPAAGETLVPDPAIASMLKEISADSMKAYVTRMVGFGTRQSMSDTVSTTSGIGAARRWVASKFLQFRRETGASMSVVLDPYEVAPQNRVKRPVVMKNVLATLKGTDPSDDRVLLVSGHLDSRNTDVMDSVGAAPGANDDASGVAVVLELARVMSKRKFPCSIVFMAVQGEEQGLVGARHMAEKMKLEKANLIAMLNNDIVGNSLAGETGERNDRTVRVFSTMIPFDESPEEEEVRKAMRTENDSKSRQLARYIKETGDLYSKNFSVTINMRMDRYGRGGDHAPFLQKGFTAVRFTEYHENFTQQHQNVRMEGGRQYGDLIQFMDFPYAANVARMNLATLASLALAPAAPVKVEMQTGPLSNKTLLHWEAPAAGSKPKGYYILLRETFQPFWEKRVFVTDTRAELPYSKDNYFFAVQTVGENGHVSMMVMPVPEK